LAVWRTTRWRVRALHRRRTVPRMTLAISNACVRTALVRRCVDTLSADIAAARLSGARPGRGARAKEARCRKPWGTMAPRNRRGWAGAPWPRASTTWPHCQANGKAITNVHLFAGGASGMRPPAGRFPPKSYALTLASPMLNEQQGPLHDEQRFPRDRPGFNALRASLRKWRAGCSLHGRSRMGDFLDLSGTTRPSENPRIATAVYTLLSLGVSRPATL
jgi:hypothetical protein